MRLPALLILTFLGGIARAEEGTLVCEWFIAQAAVIPKDLTDAKQAGRISKKDPIVDTVEIPCGNTDFTRVRVSTKSAEEWALYDKLETAGTALRHRCFRIGEKRDERTGKTYPDQWDDVVYNKPPDGYDWPWSVRRSTPPMR